MKYRREIDGLRAVAVLPVIFFHAGFAAFSGGFVGVDIFFVISGYLITSIILTEKENNSFSIVRFYERRARRILPALFLVMLCCLPFAWLWLLPKYFEDFSQSLVAVSIFASNILFWRESGYFDSLAELKPLLHTWSLAVEEQFYIIFPLLLIILWNFRKRWIFASLVIIAIASLSLAHWGAFFDPSSNFYLLPSRGWELAIGAIIALYHQYKKDHIEFVRSSIIINQTFALMGIAMICYSIFAFSKATPFPSLYALLPTIGTGLILLFATSQTFVGRLLSTKFMVGIGLISYSAYLWHQPLFAFARLKRPSGIDASLFILLSVFTLILAFLSWKYVEVPFRNKNKFSRKNIFISALVGSLIFISIGLTGYLDKGWVLRVPKSESIAINAASIRSKYFNLWLSQPGHYISAKDSFTSNLNANRYAFLIGDSHAETLASEAMKSFSKSDIGFKTLSYIACPPIKNVYRVDKAYNHKCYEYNNDVYSYIETNNNIEYVIMAARWTLYIDQHHFDNKEGGVESGGNVNLNVIESGQRAVYGNNELSNQISARINDSVSGLLDKGKKVILVYPVPEAGWNVSDYVSKLLIYDKLPLLSLSPTYASTSYDVFLDRNKETIKLLDNIPDHPNIHRVRPDHIFCNTYVRDRCVTQVNGELFYRDDNHLSFSGSKLVVDEIMKAIK